MQFAVSGALPGTMARENSRALRVSSTSHAEELLL